MCAFNCELARELYRSLFTYNDYIDKRCLQDGLNCLQALNNNLVYMQVPNYNLFTRACS